MDRVLRFPYCLTAPLLLAGFGFSLFFQGSDSPFYAPALLPLAAAGIILLFPGAKAGWAVPRAATVPLAGLYWLYLLTALLWSTSPFISTLFFLVFSIPPWLFMAIILSPDPHGAARIHAAAVLAGLTALALWAMAQFFFAFDVYGPLIRHPFLNPNNLGAAMAMGLLPAAALFMRAEDRVGAGACLALACLFAAALFATQSRAALWSVFVALPVLLPLTARPLKSRGFKILIVAAALLGVFAALHFWGAQFHDRGLNKIIGAQNPSSFTDRGVLWLTSWKMAMDHLLTGTGLGTFAFYYPAYRLPIDHSDGYFSHFDPLQFWVEMGVAAPVLFYAVLIAILARTARAVKAAREDATLTAEIAGTFTAMLTLALHAHASFPLYLPSLLIPLGGLMALWFAATEKALQETRFAVSGRKFRLAASAALAVAVVAASAWAARASAGIHYALAARAHIDAGRFAEAREMLARADFIAPPSFSRVPQYEARLRMMQLSDKALSPEEKARLIDEGVRYLDEAAALNPAVAHYRGEKAKFYYQAYKLGRMPDGYPRAVAELRAVLAADPLFLNGRVALAAIHNDYGDVKQALEVLEEGLPWPRPKGQPDVDFLVATARLRLELGDREGHDALIQQAFLRARHYGLMKPGPSARP